MEPWIQTFTGKKVYPLALEVDSIYIEDIAHALSLKCRFGGHIKNFYSVAEHSVRVSQILPPHLQLIGLLHDAAEAYLCDIASPIKSHILVSHDARTYIPVRETIIPCTRCGRVDRDSFSSAEDYALRQIGKALGVEIPTPLPGAVKSADGILLMTEARDMFVGKVPNNFAPDSPILHEIIVPWSPVDAENRFLQTFEKLMSESNAKS